MRSIALTGVDNVGNAVKLTKDVRMFTDAKNYFRIKMGINDLTVITPKGSYKLTKHPILNIYMGECNGSKCHVSLKKIVGELRYWPKDQK